MSKNKKSKSPVTGQEYQASSEPRYTGIPTFMRSPLATTLDDLEIALVGVPYDGGVTNRAGARHGPRAVSYTHLRAHETVLDLVCRLLLEKKK